LSKYTSAELNAFRASKFDTAQEPCPSVLVLDENDQQVVAAYSWYSENCPDMGVARGWLLEWARADGVLTAEELDVLERVEVARVVATWCYTARMLTRLLPLPGSYADRLRSNLQAFCSRVAPEIDRPRDDRPKISRRRSTETDLIASLESELDAFYRAGYKKRKLDVQAAIDRADGGAPLCRAVAAYYRPLAEELEQAFRRDSPEDLREGYSRLTREQLRTYIELVRSFVLAAENRLAVLEGTRQRRARAKRPPIRPEKLVRDVQRLEADQELGVRSIDPVKIVGAQVLWAFNVKTRRLQRYVATDQTGLSVRGTRVINYAEGPDASSSKTIRKPSEVVGRVLEAGKVELRRLWDSIKTNASTPSGRLNHDTILLRVQT
jgi:hypothetical protein